MNTGFESLAWPEFESRPAPRPRSSFVRAVFRRIEPERRIQLISLQFDMGQFDSDLFEQFGIDVTDSVRASVPRRQAEFLAGRLAARWCMEQSGFAPDPIPAVPVGQHRAPVWPGGVLGSITHTAGHAICALCPTETASGLGVDLEELLDPARAQSIAAQIHDDDELALAVRSGLAPNAATTLIFSAKESLFKALYSRVGEYFGFEQARLLEVSASRGRLVLELREEFHRRHALPARLDCRFALDAQGALTLVSDAPSG